MEIEEQKKVSNDKQIKFLWENIIKNEINNIKKFFEKFKDFDANIPLNPLGMTALMIATTAKRDQIVLFLLKEIKINVNAQDYLGRTALHYAASNGFTDVIQPLIQKGADVNIITMGMETPLMKAAIFRNFLCINLLLQCQKINKYAKNSLGQTFLDILHLTEEEVKLKIKESLIKK